MKLAAVPIAAVFLAACRGDHRNAQAVNPTGSVAATAEPSGSAMHIIHPPSDAGAAPVAPVDSTAALPVASSEPSTGVTRPRASEALPHPSSSAIIPVAPSTAVAAPAVSAPIAMPRRGAVASGPSYEAWLETTGGYAVGAPAATLVVLNAKAPYKCNVQYPYKLALDAPSSGVSYPNGIVRGMRVDGKHATMPVPFSTTGAGSYTVGGTLSFSTCNAEQCLVNKVHLGVTVDVR